MLPVGALLVHILDESPRVILLRSGSSSLIGLFLLFISIGRTCLSLMAVGSLLVNPLGVVPETAIDCLRRQGSEELRLGVIGFV